jgi:hypothetical protein
MADLPRRSGDGLFSLMLRPCTAEILRHLLDPEVPFIWVVGHYPNRYLEWWECRLPLSRSSEPLLLDVRGLRFDLLLPASDFFERLSEFDSLVLHQMRHRVPNTLSLDGLENHNRVRVLIENGLFASFYLPHAMECGSFATVERSTMEKVLESEAVRRLAY